MKIVTHGRKLQAPVIKETQTTEKSSKKKGYELEETKEEK